MLSAVRLLFWKMKKIIKNFLNLFKSSEKSNLNSIEELRALKLHKENPQTFGPREKLMIRYKKQMSKKTSWLNKKPPPKLFRDVSESQTKADTISKLNLYSKQVFSNVQA